MKITYVSILLLELCLLETGLCVINLNQSVNFDGKTTIQTYNIQNDGDYEIAAGGGCGGGNYDGNGGRGGLSAGIFSLKRNNFILVSLGSFGTSVSAHCSTAGGGGATLVFLRGNSADVKSEQLILVGSGGGGGGYGQSAIDPDYNGLNDAVGTNCILSKDTDFYQAAEGRSYKLTINFTSNIVVNQTTGCFGGYGGGGQGGYLFDNQNYSSAGGGGGGGGGYEGGKTMINKAYGTCTAGGPGKPYAIKMENVKKDIPRVNLGSPGYFKIQIFQPYQKLPDLDRTNYEAPSQTTLTGRVVSFSVWILITLLILIEASWKYME